MIKAPAIGDWLVPRDGLRMPGMVVDILPSGTHCVLASKWPSKNYEVVEEVYKTSELKGPMKGKKLL